MLFPNIKNVVYSIGRIKDGLFHPLGTGTLLNKPGHLVTCAHVVDGSDNNLVVRLNNNFEGDYQDTLNNVHNCHYAKIKAIDPLRDLCVITVDSPATSNINISNTDTLNPGDQVTVFGFPHSDLGRVVLTQQTCEIGAKILLGSNNIKSKHVVLNIQARPGQSGGPIFNNSDGSIIGLLIGAYVPTIEAGILLGNIDPQTLHQTTHAISTEYLEGML